MKIRVIDEIGIVEMLKKTRVELEVLVRVVENMLEKKLFPLPFNVI
jgi:hypothetical protein